MELLKLLRAESKDQGLRVLVVAVFSGIVNGLLVAIIINAADQAAPGTLQFRYLLMFSATFIALIFSRRYTLTQTAEITERMATRIRLRIIDKIRRTNLLFFDQLGKPPLYSAITQSIFTLSQSAPALISAFAASVMLVFAAGYIAVLSMKAFQLTLVFIAAGIAYFFWISKRVESELAQATSQETEFLGHLNHLLEGFKEVKMSQARNDDLYDNFISDVCQQATELKLQTNQHITSMNIFGISFSYALIAVIVFLLPTLSSEDYGKVSQIAAAVLFILGPVTEVVGAVTHILRSNEAVQNIQNVEQRLDRATSAEPDFEPPTSPAQRQFNLFGCKEMQFTYESTIPNGDAFTLGPLTWTIPQGEVVFIVGGNGSGKSTMLKLLVGLYAPMAGHFFVDDLLITPLNTPEYRHLFSPIFTDFHLFDRLYGMRDTDPALVEARLLEMELHTRTQFKNGGFTDIQLSTGQRKRLALVVALLEERPILVFDEVAADQDPHFRKRFYLEIIPELKRQGKTIIAATHDDHYFSVADRVIKLEYGHFAEG